MFKPAAVALMLLCACSSPSPRPAVQAGPRTLDTAAAPAALAAEPQAAPAAPASPQVAPPGGIAREALALHNRERERVGVPALAWDAALEGMASEWARRLCATGGLQHRQVPEDGPEENLWRGAATDAGSMPIADAVQNWAAEQRGYDARTGSCRGVCGHYTQLVWGATTHVGCGQATCPDGGMNATVWVCNYRPAGNVAGERAF